MSKDGRSGGITPTSSTYDPSAHDFVPNEKTKSNSGASSTARDSTSRAGFSGSWNGAPGSTGRIAARPPQPLFSSDMWATPIDPPIRSAGLPSKPSWDSLPRSPLHFAQAGRSPIAPSSPRPGLTPKSGQGKSPLASFENNSSNNIAMQGDDGRFASAKFASSGSRASGLRFTQTEEYHKQAPQQSQSSMRHTDPLPQHPFTGAEFKTESSSSGGSGSSFNWRVPDTPRSMTSNGGTQGVGDRYQSSSADGTCSPGSSSVALSDHYAKANPQQAGAKGDVWQEEYHPRNLRRALQDPSADWSEAYPGSVTILTAMNPEAYQMPYGTRVVNIKAEYPENILRSIQEGKYSVMEKIAERIMQVWDAREDRVEKVLFLFSIKTGKKFCGVAEMSGPWDRFDSIKGWKDNHASAPSLGVFPLTWVFIKDIAYHQFAHIKQPQGQQSVSNMWNGMNFPSDVGRKVMQVFVTTPATSSILGFPKNYPENFGLVPPVGTYSTLNSGLVRRGTAYPRGGYSGRSWRGGRGSWRTAHRAISFRDQHNDYDNHSDDESTPIPSKPVGLLTDGKSEPPKYGQSTADAIQPALNPLMTFAINEKGQMVVVEIASEEHRKWMMSGPQNDSYSSFGSSSTEVGGAPEYHNMHESVEDQRDRFGDETPTHRPAPHSGRPPMAIHSTHSTAVTPNGSPIKMPNEFELKSQFHALLAEHYTLQAQLLATDPADAKIGLLKNELARSQAEKHVVENQLSSMGFAVEANTGTPARHDSFSSIEEETSFSSPSGYDVRAQDGRRLRSISKMNSPELNQESGFDMAPGGSGRQQGHRRSDSGDWHVKKSITDLLKSPEKSPTSAQRAHETSSFFPENVPASATRNTFGFTGPAEQKANLSKSFNIPSPLDVAGLGVQIRGVSITNSAQKSFSFGGPGQQSNRSPGGPPTPTSPSFNHGASGLSPVTQSFSFTSPGDQYARNFDPARTPTACNFSFGPGCPSPATNAGQKNSIGSSGPREKGDRKPNTKGTPAQGATASASTAAHHDDGASDVTDCSEKKYGPGGVRLD